MTDGRKFLQPQARQALEGHVKKNCLPAIFFTKFSSENLHTLYANKRRALLGARSLTNPGSATHWACWFAIRNGCPKSKRRKKIKKSHNPARTRLWHGKKISLYFVEENYFFFKYFTQSRDTAARMMSPLNTNCKLVSIPRKVRQ